MSEYNGKKLRGKRMDMKRGQFPLKTLCVILVTTFLEENSMLNEEKIRRMTEISLFEKKEASMLRVVNTYFRRDYIARHLWQSFFSYTFCFISVAGVAFLYKLDWILNAAGRKETFFGAGTMAVLYISGLILFEMLTAHIYGKRYYLARKKREAYLLQLNKMKRYYDILERYRILSREGDRNA